MKTDWNLEIAAPPARVWEELTRTGTPQPFYFGSVLEADLRPGGALRYVTPDRQHAFIEGEVVEAVPAGRLVHTFRFNDLPEPAQTVTFALEPLGTGTRIAIHHEGLAAAPRHGKRVEGGWDQILRELKAWTETGKVSFGARLRNRLMTLAAPLMPKKDPRQGERISKK